jgi:predicted alpha/beta hydrolase
MAAEIPLHFGDPGLPVFGHWHLPSGRVRDTAVLLCPAYGREEVSSHRSLRHLALQLAAAGLPVLRFDYLNTGDSADADPCGDHCTAWRRSIALALEELKRRSGATRLAVVGLRLGALLAAQVAAQRGDVAAFVSVAGVTSGRAFVRELKALQAASRLRGAAPAQDQLLESGGYAMNAATREALAALDLRQLPAPPAPRLLVVERDDLPASSAWLQPLAAEGCAVEQRQIPGYAAMMQDPHNTQVPQALLDEVVQWLAASSQPAAHAVRLPALPQAATMDGAVLEQPVALPIGGTRLCGILSRPVRFDGPVDAVLLLNAGAQRRIGPSRLHVALARQWAARGTLVLRLDISGLGDSPPRPGAPDNVVYSPWAVDEAAAAVAWLRAEWPVRDCSVVGLCAGAYHALKLAVHGAPVQRIVAINPLTFFWHESMPLDAPMPAHHVASEMARYRANLFARERWLKLLKGQVDLDYLCALLWHRVLQLSKGPLRDLARLLRLPLREDLAGELRRIAQAGIALHFVFSRGDPGEDLLRTEAGAIVGRLRRTGALVIHHLEDADHTLTGAGARARAAALLTALVLQDRAASPPSSPALQQLDAVEPRRTGVAHDLDEIA